MKKFKLPHTFYNHPKRWFENSYSRGNIANAALEKVASFIFQGINDKVFYIDHLPESLHALENDKQTCYLFLTIKQAMGNDTYFSIGSNFLEAINHILVQIEKSYAFSGIECLKIDIVTEVHRLDNFDINNSTPYERSQFGLAFDRGSGLIFLAEQLVASTIVNNKQKLKIKNIIKNFNLTVNQQKIVKKKNPTLFFFGYQSAYCTMQSWGVLYRGHNIIHSFDKNVLLNAAIQAGEYLCSCVKSDGSFIYEYFPKKNEMSNRYNILRHAGSVYAMLELFQHTNSEVLFKSAENALNNLLAKTHSIHYHNQDYLCMIENNFVKLGANALALLALTKYILVTKDKSLLEKARRLALWLKACQDESGKFENHKMDIGDKNSTSFISNYYPGEAIFALARLYLIDLDPMWLMVAQKAADYIVQVRDKDKKITELAHDHWLLYGLNVLHSIAPNKNYITHTIKICKAIMNAQNTQGSNDKVGSFYCDARSTPTAIRAEGLAAAYELLITSHYQSEAKAVLACIKRCIRFQLQTQFTLERALYLPNPSRALGGFSKSLTDYSVRIDYVQHNISSILMLYQILLAEHLQ